jgi:hypothetical protein
MVVQKRYDLQVLRTNWKISKSLHKASSSVSKRDPLQVDGSNTSDSHISSEFKKPVPRIINHQSQDALQIRNLSTTQTFVNFEEESSLINNFLNSFKIRKEDVETKPAAE